eukprot:gene5917-6603_t
MAEPAWLKADIDKKCEICKDMVDSFNKKMQETKNHNFGGGNTDWEESRLGTYAKSESRLLEILDTVCDKVSKESTCHAMIEEYESDIYEWWEKKTSEQPKLEDFLCIERFKVCCPNNTFGPKCKDCPGGKDKLCSGHGTCSGSGTRSGSGKCECDAGYEGDLCDSCKEGYYDAGNSTCEKCHESCKDTCSNAGPENCDDCKDGWTMVEEEGCQDVNECEKGSAVCEEGTYCANNIGSYQCKGCHESCKDNCTGEGAKNCLECKDGYIKDETEGCKDVDECTDDTICVSGTYCSNTIGSYDCKECHNSCELDCKGPSNKDCSACKEGYRMIDLECQDINECKEKDASLTCPGSNEYCMNTPGSFECTACDQSCSSCLASGPSGCVKCSNGYSMVESECKDIDECSKADACDKTTEDCKNTQGSYECVCKSGFRKYQGKCVKEARDDDNDGDDNDDEDSKDEHEEL